MSTEQRVEAVERALTVLEAFEPGMNRLSLAELASRTGLYKSTILRLTGTLERRGYMVRDDDGLFGLGPSLWRMGSIYRAGFRLGEAIRPELRAIRASTGETASFLVRDGDYRVCLYRINSEKPIRHYLEEGDRLPMTGGASAHALRAFAGEKAEAYDTVRDRGYAVSRGERDPDMAGVAVPVYDRSGALLGALSASGLVTRFDEPLVSKAVAALQSSAERLREIL